MKTVKNDSLQSFTVYFQTEKGCKEVWMRPGETLVEEYLKYQTVRRIKNGKFCKSRCLCN
jgi:hypothetical protein